MIYLSKCKQTANLHIASQKIVIFDRCYRTTSVKTQKYFSTSVYIDISTSFRVSFVKIGEWPHGEKCVRKFQLKSSFENRPRKSHFSSPLKIH